jgi:hypothetical protein
MITKTLSRRLEPLEGRFGVGVPPLEIRISYVEPDGETTFGYTLLIGGKRSDEDNHRAPSQA